jgi:mono/diheme cytochrome c family protein
MNRLVKILSSNALPGFSFVAIVACAFVLAALPARVQAQPQRAQNAPAGDAAKGQQAFSTHMCATCHGPEGQGAVGPQIAPPGRAFPDFVQKVRQPAGKMPPFSAQALPDSDLTDIYAYLQSLNSNATGNLSSLTGNAQSGARIFVADGCYECHGRVGQGSTQTSAPRIGPPALTIDGFARYIHAPTGNMPPYTSKVVSDQEVADIYAFLKSLPTPPPAKDIPLLNQ